MSNNLKTKIESRQQSNKKLKNNKIFSSNTLGSINKETTEKKIFKDLSLNFLKNYSTTTLTNKTCANHNHKKIIIKEKSRLNNNRKIALNINNHNKYIKFPLKLNYKQSISLKNLGEEDNILNAPLRSSDKRKNTNTKIELFSTNSTLSFLNIKDNNKDTSKPVKIKNFNCNKTKKNFSSTFIERKIRQKTKSNNKIKIKHIKNNLSLDKKSKTNLQKIKKQGTKDNNLFNTSNKSIEFCLSYMKPINKRRNLSIGINENSNSNTNSIKDLYKKKIKHSNLDSSNLLYDNVSFSLNKNRNNVYPYGQRRGCSFSKKIKLNTYCKNTINNNSKKKFNLSSLPNLLCNNYMNMHNNTMSTNDLFNFSNKNKKILKYNKNKSSYQNFFEQKNNSKNYIKLNNKNYNSFKSNLNINKMNINESDIKKIDEIKYNYDKHNNNKYNINEKLENIHFGIKSLLDGLYNIYLNANMNMNNVI